jgi:hypothetical protein
MTACARYRESLGGYVLNALDPDEAEAMRTHLRSCESCRLEYTELQGLPGLLATLSDDATPELPPPTLEEAVLDRFARERRSLRPVRRPRLPRWGRLAGAVAAAGVAAAAGLALAGVFDSGSESGTFGEVHLAGTAQASSATANAKLHAVRAGTGVTLRVSGLPPAHSQVYELWCIPDDGRWISGGTFRVDGRGGARVTLTSAARPGDYERMLVTRRPARGVEGSRGAGVLAGRVEY